jgi:alanine-glyoxylate transaminase/serine-glyoxylate transaminase/serine-pyruvate transaminase
MPEGLDSNALIARARDRFDLALGVGLGKLRGRIFRIGHLGALNELEVLATLGGVEMALRECGHALAAGTGVAAAEDRFLTHAKPVETSRRM